MNIYHFFITFLTSIIFTLIIVTKIKIGIVLSLIILLLPVYWIISKQIDEKKFICVFFIIYPLLPFLAGVNIGSEIPVLRSHRIAILLLITFLLSKGLFLKYYKDFTNSDVFSLNIIIVLISMLVSAFFSANMQGTLFYMISTIVELLIFSVAIFSAFESYRDIEKLINSLLISCSLLCIFGLFEKMTSYNFYSEFGSFHDYLSRQLTHQIRDGGIRIQGPFEHSISYSAYIVLVFPLFLYKFKNNFMLFNMSIILILSAIFASQSRAGILGAAIIILLYIIFIQRKNLVLIFILSLPVFIYNSGDILNFLVDLNPFTTSSSEMADSSSARIRQIMLLSGFIKQNLAFGYGATSPENIETIDNYYLTYVFQFGIFGLISYILLIMSVLIKPLLVFGHKIRNEQLLLMLLFSIISFIIINTLVCLPSYHFIFYVYVGIITRLIVNKRNEEKANA